MANPLFDPADIDFHGEEVKALAETLFDGFFEKPALTLFHDIVPGIKAKKQVIILGVLDSLVGLGNGSCSPTPNLVEGSARQKFWDPASISDRIEFCWTDLKETFWIWGTQNGLDKYDLTKTEFFVFLTELIEDAMLEAVLRIAWFNDLAAETVTDGGIITDGTPIAAFNRINGLWQQIYVIVTADADRRTLGLDTRNGGASYTAQQFTAADTTNRVVMNTLQNMRYGADERMEARADLIYIVTRSVAQQYERELKAANIAFTTERIENGIQKLISDGIEVYSFNFWDRMIRTYLNDGTKWYQPHRALLTTKTNMKIGTEEESNFTEMDVWFDKNDKKTKLDFLFNEDAKVGLDHFLQVAY